MPLTDLQQRSRRNEPLNRYTTSRIGGAADLLIVTQTTSELVEVCQRADEMQIPFTVIGGGANILVSDAGVRGLVVINRAKEIKFTARGVQARVEVDSGVNLITLARDCIERGYAGLEWAIGVPGTVGGAVVGNAGAHGADIGSNLYMAKLLKRGGGPEYWTNRQLQFGYRKSALKQYASQERPIVLSAIFDLKMDYRANLERRASELNTKRRASQPPGASIGSMFKNPPNDFAGRLIEAAGLKGRTMGGAMISDKHANFFVNLGEATASDVKALIDLAHEAVLKQFGIDLALEVELVGEWHTDERVEIES
jgi:UDP-N-acetylmuramate dehydrogenase